MIPNIIHFISVGGRPFSFIHLLAVYSAWKVNNPDTMYFHCTSEPFGKYWECAKELLTINIIEDVIQVFGNPVTAPQHKVDVIRLDMLIRHGGIYLDLDVICLNSFKPLLQYPCVMGIEMDVGLCNAVILAKNQSSFLEQWRSSYVNFDETQWNFHSIVLPAKLAYQYPTEIHIEDKYSFFYPSHNDPAHHYLWGGRPMLSDLCLRLAKNLVRTVQMTLKADQNLVRRSYYNTFHLLRGKRWHYERARSAYCLHLWESLWGKNI